MSDEIPVKEIGQLLEDVSEKLPKILNGIMDTLYSAESGRKVGQAVGGFYKELIDSGIPSEDALKMAKDFMFSIKDMANAFGSKTGKSE
ncbi:MAG: hypothetical protein GXZ01_01595 [Clostridiaceae bacterium]|nr:hypothetical protein [Clostridiaceae bacterium]